MRTFEEEKMQMTDNPQEFVKTALDACDKQKLPDLKSQASKLLECLCDKMDGTILNTGILCLEILKYTVTKEGSIENYSAYSIAYQNSHFFQTAN